MNGHPYIKTPGGPRAGTFEDDAEVVVFGQETEGGDWEAVWILVKPVRPEIPIHGVVIRVDGDDVTVETPDGDNETLTFPGRGHDLTLGEVITVFRGKSGNNNGLVRAEDVKNRLKGFLEDVEEDVDEPEEVVDGNGLKHDQEAAHAERVADFLARFSERQSELIIRVIDRAPASVKAKLEQVRDRIQEQRAEHMEAIQRIRAKLDRAHPDHSHQGGSDSAGQLRPERADQDQGGEHPIDDGGRGQGRGRGQGDSTETPTP